MNSKPLKCEPSNKKKLVLTNDHKQCSHRNSNSNIAKIIPTHKQRRISSNKDFQKENHCTHLPPIPSLSNLRLSQSVPPDQSFLKRNNALTSTDKLVSSLKARPSCFLLTSRIRLTKIEDTVSSFISSSVQRDLFHMHFGKYLVQPKNLYHILLFALNSFNNSKNMAQLHKNIMDFAAYDTLVRQLEQDQFNFKFGTREHKKMGFCTKTVDLKCENERMKDLITEGDLLASKNQTLLKDIMQRRKEKQQIEKDILRYQGSIKELQQEIKRLNTEISKLNETSHHLTNIIRENQSICERLEEKKKYYTTFLINFNENKYNQVAVASKRLEQDLFEYVEYLNFHPLGKRTYQKSKYSSEMERRITNELQQFCRFLHEQHVPAQQKSSTCKEFILKIKEQYSCIISQLQGVIQEKTEFITEFTKIMANWHNNYLSKKDILNQLNSIISYENINLEEMKVVPLGWGKSAGQSNTDKEVKIINIAEKIINIFTIASSFF